MSKQTSTQPQLRPNQHRHGQPLGPVHNLHAYLVHLNVLLFQLALLHDGLVYSLALLARSHQTPRTVCSSNPKAATIACTGHPFTSNVITTVNNTSGFLIPNNAVSCR